MQKVLSFGLLILSCCSMVFGQTNEAPAAAKNDASTPTAAVGAATFTTPGVYLVRVDLSIEMEYLSYLLTNS